MAGAKHTWRYDYEPGYGGEISDAEKALRAAAPKLLDLAQFFVSNHDQITPADIQRAKAVIAEALGEGK